MGEMTGGRAVVELLKAEQVRYIFGIVGATFLDVLDALYDDRSVEYINVRHEQGAAFMADGLARVTGLPGVCLVTSGPGATNLLTGVAAAYVAHSPVVVLVGGIAVEHYQKDAFQEFDLVGMFRPVTKSAVQITQAHRIPELLRAALRTAMSGRRGPVLVEIPRDVLNDTVSLSATLPPSSYRPRTRRCRIRTPSVRRRGSCVTRTARSCSPAAASTGPAPATSSSASARNTRSR